MSMDTSRPFASAKALPGSDLQAHRRHDASWGRDRGCRHTPQWILAGLYIAAIAMVAILAFMISGAWLLIMGASEHRNTDRRDDGRKES